MQNFAFVESAEFKVCLWHLSAVDNSQLPDSLYCVPPKMSMPLPFKVCTGMWFIHGFILDIVVINILPYLSAKVSDAQRADKFPWALGGYKGTLNKEKACD